ncbi:MAG: hypothetical protein Q4P06_01975 [Actinomycetaceae bacterium]|nr:hypothetical protein [Actinomycetaceae bacterium]
MRILTTLLLATTITGGVWLPLATFTPAGSALSTTEFIASAAAAEWKQESSWYKSKQSCESRGITLTGMNIAFTYDFRFNQAGRLTLSYPPVRPDGPLTASFNERI